MLVEFQGTWRGHRIHVNPAHVKTLRPVTEVAQVAEENQFGRLTTVSKSFAVFGHTAIEYAVSSGEDAFGDVVIGTLDEVAAKLNAVSSRHFEKALAMAVEYEQRHNTEAPCRS